MFVQLFVPRRRACDEPSRGEAYVARPAGREITARRGIVIRSHSARGVAEEAPAAYKDVDAVVQAAHDASISRKVARPEPLVCIKG